jgi:alanine dehydrogenase
MKIAVLCESKEEYRVSLTPIDVKRLTRDKHEVYVQKTAGALAGFTDGEYLASGAKIVSYRQAIKNADIILKVSQSDKEIRLMKTQQ